MLTPDFGTVKNLNNMDSNGEVISIKKFRIVDMNIFEVYIDNTKLFYGDHFSIKKFRIVDMNIFEV